MVLYNCEVQADISWFIKLEFSKVFYKYCRFCLNVGVGTALLWQLGVSDVPHLSGVLGVPQAHSICSEYPEITSVITSDFPTVV